ncbi:MAG: hypothetical protein AAF587_05885 [Bacteroidota bacterium]
MQAIVHLIHIMLSIFLGLMMFLFPTHIYGQNFFNTYFSGKNGKTTIEFQNNNDKFKVEYEGDIRLANDDRDIVDISDGGFMEIRKTAFGSTRKVRIESNGRGYLNREYFVGRRRADYDSEGRRWLAEVLPEIVRSSALAAEDRVERYYSNGGASALLQEIQRLDGDYVKHVYCDLAVQKRLSISQMVQLLSLAGDEIHSDFYLSKLLKDNAEQFLSDPQTLEAYIDASHNISSDFHKSEIMRAAINNGQLSAANVNRLLAMSQNIDSDYHKAEVLKLLLRSHPLTLNNVDQVLRAAEEIDSDFHTDEVLSALLTNQLDEQALRTLYNHVGNNVSSDFHKDQILSRAINQQNICGTNLHGFVQALRAIDSDFHQSHVMVKVGKEVDLTDEDLIDLLGAIDNIESNFHKTEVLKAFAPQVNAAGDRVYDAFLRAAKTVSSKHDYGQIMRSLGERGRYQEE